MHKYIPILRSKRAEWEAIKHTSSKRLTPVFEVLPKDFVLTAREDRGDVPARPLARFATRAATCMNGRKFFLDCQHIPDDFKTHKGKHPILALTEKLRTAGQRPIPVISPTYGPNYREYFDAIDTRSSGICIRIFAPTTTVNAATSFIHEILRARKLTYSDATLIVDYRIVSDSTVSASRFVQQLAALGDWRRIALTSGAFPKNLSHLEVGEHLLPRHDWQFWQRSTQATFGDKVAYSDYTIQHPLFTEPPTRANFSASIRYTTDDVWLVLRGQGVFVDGGGGFAQWPANAQVLCGRDEFSGSQFSPGDAYISEMANQTETTGSAETWIRAGISHHLSFVLAQLRARDA